MYSTQANAEFVANMEDVLAVYARAYEAHAKCMKVKPKETGEGYIIFEYRITAA